MLLSLTLSLPFGTPPESVASSASGNGETGALEVPRRQIFFVEIALKVPAVKIDCGIAMDDAIMLPRRCCRSRQWTDGFFKNIGALGKEAPMKPKVEET